MRGGVAGRSAAVRHSRSAGASADYETRQVVLEADLDLAPSTIDVQRRLGISDADVLRCRDAFRDADTAGNEAINISELQRLLEGVTGHKLELGEPESLVARFESPSKLLSFDTFLEAFASTHAYQSEHAAGMLKNIGHQSRKDIEYSLADPEQRIKFVGVPIDIVRRFLDDELEQMAACISLPFVVILFVSFCCSVSFHAGIQEIHAQRRALSFDLEENALFNYFQTAPYENLRVGDKNFFKVNTFQDFWSWLQLGLVPIFWGDHGWGTSEVQGNIRFRCRGLESSFGRFGFSLNQTSGDVHGVDPANETCLADGMDPERVTRWQSITPTYRYFHTFVGGVRLRQEQSEQVECLQASTFGESIHKGVCIKPSIHWMMPQPWMGYMFDNENLVNQPRGETAYLLAGLPPEKIRSTLRELENKGWMSPLTSKVEVMFSTYNPHIDLVMVSHLNVWVNTAGHFHHMVQSQGFWLTTYPWWGCWVADIVWLLSLIKLFVEEGTQLWRSCARLGLAQGFRKYWSWSNLVDWINILAGTVIMTWWFVYNGELSTLQSFLQEASYGQTGNWVSEETREKYFDHIHHMAAGSGIRFLLLAMYPIIMVTKVFKVCAGQPRLALVTKTITRATVDVVHFGLVFLSVFALFTETSVLLFGSDMEQFSTFLRAADSSFHVLMGDLDWNDFHTIGHVPAAMWYWSFIWLLHLVMFNMLLVMIMDVYTETRGSIGGDAETLWSQTYEIYRRWKQARAGKRLSLTYVRECLSYQLADQDLHLTVSGFMDVVQGLKPWQASRLLTNSLKFWDNENKQSQSLAEASTRIQMIGQNIDELKDSVGSLLHMGNLNATILAQSQAEQKSTDLQTSQAKEIAEMKSTEFPVEKPERGTPEIKECLQLLSRLENRIETRFNQFDVKVSSLEAQINQLTAPMDPRRSTGFCGAPARAAALKV